jgi:hypothetical protein
VKAYTSYVINAGKEESAELMIERDERGSNEARDQPALFSANLDNIFPYFRTR